MAKALGATEKSTVKLPAKQANVSDASRLLTQATFGARLSDIERVKLIGPKAWVDEQVSMPYDASRGLMAHLSAQATLGNPVYQDTALDGFWKQAITAPDQLRARMAFALSQLFVVSFQSIENPDVIASYYDTLSTNAFGDYRRLLEAVVRHPAMGNYLSYMYNQKEDLVSGRNPDENMAREIMQLFSIGLYQLNLDGTNKLDSAGNPIATYGNADVQGLARVFTGWSWAGPDKSDSRFWNSPGKGSSAFSSPMQAYPKFHSTAEKSFLGTTIGVQASADPEASLKAALDAIAAHPNVAPFISRQLIQRLVSSNPSAAYVARMARVFNDNGQGKRGDMGALVKAILLDTEARSTEATAIAGYGKLKEPILRATAWMRAFNVSSLSGNYTVGITDSQSASLNQSPLRSPSVFNFYRPGYVPPGTQMGNLGMAVPEMQINTTSSAAGYVNAMYYWVLYGAGRQVPGTADKFDLTPDYTLEKSLVAQPERLLDHLNTLLFAGRMSATLRQQLLDAMAAIPSGSTADAQAGARVQRMYLTLLMSMVSTDFLIQK